MKQLPAKQKNNLNPRVARLCGKAHLIMIYTPHILDLEMQRNRSQSSSPAAKANIFEGMCSQCHQKKHKKGGTIRLTRSGKRLFKCKECSHAAQ